ncbi:MAG: putative toxin-antitoxin system toxin component, PIN family [Acidobacteriota bacterium]|nr:putative toxin-antitoxin system toxin component, PIN family [Acidobacteriota bacterium]MDW3229089.1 putative toxin-antitoxin system toxin component, PIN family [Acidobacteriota bacterium]MDY0231977.1 putative toxin-antitoxin system toxin component, PIN family [Candidatus Saccharicenans sp.]
MGQKKVKEFKDKTRPRLVLDTSVFISALLFDRQPGKLINLWQGGKIVFLVSAEVFKEYLAVLSYPKFRLTKKEIKSLIEAEVVPFLEPVRIKTKLQVVSKDPSDDKFLELAVDGKADFLVSGDKHLLELRSYQGTKIIPVAEFLRRYR